MNVSCCQLTPFLMVPVNLLEPQFPWVSFWQLRKCQLSSARAHTRVALLVDSAGAASPVALHAHDTAPKPFIKSASGSRNACAQQEFHNREVQSWIHKPGFDFGKPRSRNELFLRWSDSRTQFFGIFPSSLCSLLCSPVHGGNIRSLWPSFH